MSRGCWMVLLALVVLAEAAVMPLDRDRLALPDDRSSTTTPKETFCAHETPCAWSIYERLTKVVELNLSNSYCECAPGKNCIRTEDVKPAYNYVYRCRTEEEAKLYNIDS